MAVRAQWPNVYTTQAAVSAGSTAVVGDAFGFNARTVRLLNTEAVDFYVSLTSTAVATTGAMRVRACSDLVLPLGGASAGFAAYTTSTGASAKVLGVTAFGGDAG